MSDKNLATDFMNEMHEMKIKPDQKLITSDMWNDLKLEQVKVCFLNLVLNSFELINFFFF